MDFKLPNLPQGSKIEPNYDFIDKMAKDRQSQDRINFWVPVSISLLALALAAYSLVLQIKTTQPPTEKSKPPNKVQKP